MRRKATSALIELISDGPIPSLHSEEVVPSRADRPYGSFLRARPDEPEATPDTTVRPVRVGAVRRHALLLVTTLAAAAVLVPIALAPIPKAPPVIEPSPGPPPTIAALYEKVAPTVVQVKITRYDGSVQPSAGAGVIIDEAADIITALHVVGAAKDVSVIFSDGKESKAVVIAVLADNDIAVLRALEPPQTVVPAVLGDGSKVRIGDDALVVGSPFGMTRSLSTGVISGLNRSLQVPGYAKPLTGLIQFDAAANPGNSGGPLFNRNGDVIGIVTAIANPTGFPVFSGLGFAITIDAAGGALGIPVD
ncbi:MAG: trypsin-like serine protease [Chloroflexi bacterium]|nr:MAG: trypsin-like serine protease [Chloroflexota bacterium]